MGLISSSRNASSRPRTLFVVTSACGDGDRSAFPYYRQPHFDSSMSDPSPICCGICFDDYAVDVLPGAEVSPRQRHPSSSCRHAICLKCAIQHVIAFSRTVCPFCRQDGAFSSDFATVCATTKNFSPSALEILALVATARKVRAEREAALASARRMYCALQLVAATLTFQDEGPDNIPVMQLTPNLCVALLRFSRHNGSLSLTLAFRSSVDSRDLFRKQITLGGIDDQVEVSA